METQQSVLRSVRAGDWMVSVDLKDAYLQVPIHQESRKYLRFVSSTGTFQFKVLCFGLTTAPQVFTRVMAPVSAYMHRLGFRLIRYLDDWLILASSRQEALQARDTLLHLCLVLGIQVNLDKSNLEPSQVTTYLGMDIHSVSMRVFPTQKRISDLHTQLEEFWSETIQPVSIWKSLLGRMSSLSLLIPGFRLRMRSFQLCLRRNWDFWSEDATVGWFPDCLRDLQWWSEDSNLTPGVPLEIPLPDFYLYTDASDQGWGAALGDSHISGQWSDSEKTESINFRELQAILLAVQHFLPMLGQKRVAVFSEKP